jgi:phosphate transport system protein
MLKINNDLERIADCAVNMAERARHVDRGAMRAYRSELTEMGERSRTMLRNAVQSFAVQSVETAVNMSHEDDTVDALYGKMINRIVAEGASSPEDMASRLDILSVAKNLERIADHATNVAEDVVFLSTGHIIRHGEGPEEFGGA